MTERDRPTEGSEEIALKDLDDALREIDHLTQACNNVFSLQNLNVAERYANHGLRVILNLRSRRTSRQYNLIFKSLGIDNLDNGIRGGGDVGANGAAAPVRSIKDERHQACVGVIISKSIDSPEQVIPSLVWLEPANQLLSRAREVLYFSLCRGKFELLQVSGEGEIDLACILAICNCKGTRDIVENGTQMERDFTDHDWKHLWDRRDQEFNRLVNAIGLRLTNDYVRSVKSINGAFDILDVLIGPCDLDLDPM